MRVPRWILVLVVAVAATFGVIAVIIVATRSEPATDSVGTVEHDDPSDGSRPDEDASRQTVQRFMNGYLAVTYGKVPATEKNLPAASAFLRERITTDLTRGSGTKGTRLARLEPTVTGVEWMATGTLGMTWQVTVWDGETSRTLTLNVSEGPQGLEVTSVR